MNASSKILSKNTVLDSFFGHGKERPKSSIEIWDSKHKNDLRGHPVRETKFSISLTAQINRYTTFQTLNFKQRTMYGFRQHTATAHTTQTRSEQHTALLS